MRLESVHPKELGARESAAWRRIRDASPALSSPYFSFGFAQSMGAARDDARVVVIEDGGAIQGFFPAQRPSVFTAMAMGTPISDYQGVIGARDLDVAAAHLCRALRVGRIDFSTMDLTSQSLTAGAVRNTCVAYYAAIGEGGSKAYLADLKAERSDTIKKMDRKRRAMGRDVGGVVFTPDDRTPAHFEQLMRWAREKCRQSHVPRVWETAWVLRVIDGIRGSDDPDFRCMLFTDTVGDKLAAAQLLLQSGRVLHTWIIGQDCAFDAFSPGMALTRRVIEWAADNGFEEVDLGLGDYRFKRQLTNRTREVGAGYLGCNSWATLVRTGEYAVCRLFERAPVAQLRQLPSRAIRRLDVYRALGFS